MRLKKAALAVTTVALAGTGLFATASAASAAPAQTAAHTQATSAAYGGQCGSGYKVINSGRVGDFGTTYLTYNSSNGKNCVVTVRDKAGDPVHMAATVRVLADGTKAVTEEGDYTSYAGPVYVDAKGYCVTWGGTIDDENYTNSGSNCGSLKK